MAKTNLNVLKSTHSLFIKLLTDTPQWWDLLKNDSEIYFEIRKDSTIDIYYNGGCIIGELQLDKSGNFIWKTHTKYLLPIVSEYLKNTGTRNIQLIDTNNIDIFSLQSIKSNITKYYPNHSEKGIQARFICQKESCFLDSEFSFNDSKNKRIDMVWVDIHHKEIIFVELKLPANKELFNGSISNQLIKYKEFIEEETENILAYYKSVFIIKKQLNLLSNNLKSLVSIDDYSLSSKPLLLISKCKQEWIKDNCARINAAVSGLAWGVYYFGEPNTCNKITKTSNNRFIL